MIKRGIRLLAISAVIAQPVWGQELPEWVTRTRLSGLAYVDIYAMAANHDATIEGANGIWARRVYLTFDNSLSEQLAFRLRFEMNSPGDFTSSSKLEPFVKDLYVRWRGERQDVYLGISGTPILGLVELLWGYRSVVETPLDLQKFGSSRDFGVAIKGSFDEARIVRYHAMVGTGAGTKGETNEGKKAALSLGLHPGAGIVVEVYGDFDDRPGDTDRATFQGFVAWQGERGRVGVLLARQRREVEGGETLNIDLASAFGVVKLDDRTTLLARYDRMFDPNPDAGRIAYLPMDPTAKSNFALVGVDFALDDRFHLIPNVEAVFYEDATGSNATDVMLRTTFHVAF